MNLVSVLLNLVLLIAVFALVAMPGAIGFWEVVFLLAVAAAQALSLWLFHRRGPGGSPGRRGQ